MFVQTCQQRWGQAAFQARRRPCAGIGAALLVMTLATLVRAQSLNIDYDVGATVPSAAYAGAGRPGVWNALAAPPNVPQPLVGLDGLPVAATVTQLIASGVVVVDDPGTSGEEEALLDDFVPGLGDVAFETVFAGLEHGLYDVITYAWGPASPTERSVVCINNNWPAGQIVGGPWPGHLAWGVTHARHRALVPNGALTISVVCGNLWSDGFLNGAQLVLIATPGDLNCDGVLNAFDIDPFVLALTDPAGYAAAYPDCDRVLADINGDGVVNGFDIDPFVALLVGG